VLLATGRSTSRCGRAARSSPDFTQRDPDQGVLAAAEDRGAAWRSTTTRSYVGARMFDTAPDSVVARVARRADNSAELGHVH
jgi:hypothetical protein